MNRAVVLGLVLAFSMSAHGEMTVGDFERYMKMSDPPEWFDAHIAGLGQGLLWGVNFGKFELESAGIDHKLMFCRPERLALSVDSYKSMIMAALEDHDFADDYSAGAALAVGFIKTFPCDRN